MPFCNNQQVFPDCITLCRCGSILFAFIVAMQWPEYPNLKLQTETSTHDFDFSPSKNGWFDCLFKIFNFLHLKICWFLQFLQNGTLFEGLCDKKWNPCLRIFCEKLIQSGGDILKCESPSICTLLSATGQHRRSLFFSINICGKQPRYA